MRTMNFYFYIATLRFEKSQISTFGISIRIIMLKIDLRANVPYVILVPKYVEV